MSTRKVHTDSPSLVFRDGAPALFFKQGSRYREATAQEILGAAVLILSNRGHGQDAFNLQLALPNLRAAEPVLRKSEPGVIGKVTEETVLIGRS